MKIAKGRGMARARVAVARKLAVILHRMWSDQTEFRFGRNTAPVLRSLTQEERSTHALLERANRIVPVGTMGAAISLRAQSLRITARSHHAAARAPTAKRSQ